MSTDQTNPQSGPEPELIAALTERDEADLGNALTVLRDRIDHEFRVTERYDSKARQAFALAAALFAVAQASAFASFAESAVSSAERAIVLFAALCSAIALAYVARRLWESEQMLQEDGLAPEAVLYWCRTETKPRASTAHLIWSLGRIATARKASNRNRAKRSDAVRTAAAIAIALAAVQLLIALTVRV